MAFRHRSEKKDARIARRLAAAVLAAGLITGLVAGLPASKATAASTGGIDKVLGPDGSIVEGSRKLFDTYLATFEQWITRNAAR